MSAFTMRNWTAHRGGLIRCNIAIGCGQEVQVTPGRVYSICDYCILEYPRDRASGGDVVREQPVHLAPIPPTISEVERSEQALDVATTEQRTRRQRLRAMMIEHNAKELIAAYRAGRMEDMRSHVEMLDIVIGIEV